MVRIVLDAGHGLNTLGKRSPDDEREWSFNEAVLRATQRELALYEDVQLLRVDDPTGHVDVPLATRTSRANAWKADVYLSFHHNANTGKWGSWGGVETFTMDAPHANPTSVEIATFIQPLVVTAMNLRDRGVKKKNLHVLRETHMPAVLIEGGFMDSRTDINALRDASRLRAQGIAVANAIVTYYRLQKKGNHASRIPSQGDKPKMFRLVTGTFPTQLDAKQAAERLRVQHGWTVYVKED